VEAACAAGSAVARTAYRVIASGEADIVMAFGVEKMNESPTPMVVEFRAGNYFWEFEKLRLDFSRLLRVVRHGVCAPIRRHGRGLVQGGC